MDQIFEDICEERKLCDTVPDRLYVDRENYFSLLEQPELVVGPTTDLEEVRVFGMDVIVINDLEQGMMVLDSSEYPTARDFKDGRTQAIPLSSYYPNK